MIATQIERAIADVASGIALLYGHQRLQILRVRDGQLFAAVRGTGWDERVVSSDALDDVYEARVLAGDHGEVRIVDNPPRVAVRQAPPDAPAVRIRIDGTADPVAPGWALLRSGRTSTVPIPVAVEAPSAVWFEAATIEETDEHGNVTVVDTVLKSIGSEASA